MNDLEPHKQIRLIGLEKFMNELIKLNLNGNLPNKILLSGPKGVAKATMAYHFINFVLSQNEKYKYDLKNFEINPENRTFKTILNKSNPNLITIDLEAEKKSIDINQIRRLIINLNKSSLNDKPRFILIDNIECLNISSVNALLKVLEEPNFNIFFLLINSNKKVLPTLTSRCINFKVNLSNQESQMISEKLLNMKLSNVINKDLIDYYFTPGNLYNLVKFGNMNEYNLNDLNLKDFLKILIKNNHYKKDSHIKYVIFDLMEFYFKKINISLSKNIFDKYSYYLKKISNTKKFNLDEEILFLEFDEEILNG